MIHHTHHPLIFFNNPVIQNPPLGVFLSCAMCPFSNIDIDFLICAG